MDKKHEIVSNIKEVAAELNEIPGRNNYLKHGKFTMQEILGEFDSFKDAVNAAGLEPVKSKFQKDAEKKLDNRQGKYDDITFMRERFEKELAPSVGKHERSLEQNTKVFTIVSCSDLHSQWMDPFCFHVFQDTCKRLKPNVIALVGDICDFYQISSFSKNPRRAMQLQPEINFTKTHVFKKLREGCPDSQIDFFLGNHEWRLFKYLCTEARGLSTLDALKFDKLFDLDYYKINLVARNSFVTPSREKDAANRKVYKDKFMLTHGTATVKYPAAKEFDNFGMSGASGHVHRYNIFKIRNMYGIHQWTSMGCMCRLEAGDEYVDTMIKWNQGFLITHIYKDFVIQEYVSIRGGFASSAGKYYIDDKRIKNDQKVSLKTQHTNQGSQV